MNAPFRKCNSQKNADCAVGFLKSCGQNHNNQKIKCLIVTNISSNLFLRFCLTILRLGSLNLFNIKIIKLSIMHNWHKTEFLKFAAVYTLSKKYLDF